MMAIMATIKTNSRRSCRIHASSRLKEAEVVVLLEVQQFQEQAELELVQIQ